MDIIFRVGTILMLLTFYGIYITKLVLQKRQGIATNQMGKGKKGNKTLRIERCLSVVSWLIVAVQIYSIVTNWTMLTDSARFTGILTGFLGDIIFGIAVFNMKDSWRAGIPTEENTALVTTGIYRYSRNPAFLGFYFLYISVLLIYFNPILLVATCITIIVFHLQVLQEEKYLQKVFGEEYLSYKRKVFRYLGRKIN